MRWALLLLPLACTKVHADEATRADAVAVPPVPPAPAPPRSAGAGAAPSESTPAPASASAGDAGARPMLAHRSVLHVGDSTVGYTLGLQLELSRMFKAAGVRYESRTVTSAGLHSFATARILEKAVRERDPDLVIVQVGTNNLTVPHPDAYLPDLRSIVAQAGGRDCYWIGPISIDRPEKGMRAVIRANVGPCAFFDSFELELARQSDAIHPTQPAAKKWADKFWAFATTTPPGHGR